MFIIYPKFASTSLFVKEKTDLYDDANLNSVLLNPLVNYKFELKNFNKEFNKGEYVFVVKDNIEKGGILITLTNEYVDLEIDKTIYRIRDYSSIRQELSVKSDITEKTSIIVDNPTNLTYLFEGTSWKPIYTMNLKDSFGSFTCNANIVSNEKLEGDFTLISGSFQNLSRSLITERSVSNSVSNSEKFDEYHSYDLGYMKIDGHKTVPLFFENSLEVSKFYSHDINSVNKVEYGYSFVSPKFLPAGDVYIYNDSRYIGIFPFSETLENKSVELMIGLTTSLSCVSSVIAVQLENNTKQIEIKTKMFNENLEEIELTVKYYIGNSQVVSSSQPYTERVNNYLEWDVVVDNTQKYLFEVNLIIKND